MLRRNLAILNQVKAQDRIVSVNADSNLGLEPTVSATEGCLRLTRRVSVDATITANDRSLLISREYPPSRSPYL